MSLRLLLGSLMLLGTATATNAQKLPSPSREVFRCEVNGKVSYSDAPCLGAQKVDVEPTRGLNASSGQRRIGADVQREHVNEAFADALRPLTGQDAKQRNTAAKRLRLSGSAQRECMLLDLRIANVEARERAATGETLLPVQHELLGLRQRFSALGC